MMHLPKNIAILKETKARKGFPVLTALLAVSSISSALELMHGLDPGTNSAGAGRKNIPRIGGL